jgi:hypothetical protein
MKRIMILTAVAALFSSCLFEVEHPRINPELKPAYKATNISIPFWISDSSSPAKVRWELAFYNVGTSAWEDVAANLLQVPAETYSALALGELPEARFRLTMELLGARANDDEIPFDRIVHEFYVDRTLPSLSDITGLGTPGGGTHSASSALATTVNFASSANTDYESPTRPLAALNDVSLVIPGSHEINGNTVQIWAAGEHAPGDVVSLTLAVVDEAGNRSDLRIETYTAGP